MFSFGVNLTIIIQVYITFMHYVDCRYTEGVYSMDTRWAFWLEQKDCSEIFKRYNTSNDLFDMSSMLNKYICAYINMHSYIDCEINILYLDFWYGLENMIYYIMPLHFWYRYFLNVIN